MVPASAQSFCGLTPRVLSSLSRCANRTRLWRHCMSSGHWAASLLGVYTRYLDAERRRSIPLHLQIPAMHRKVVSSNSDQSEQEQERAEVKIGVGVHMGCLLPGWCRWGRLHTTGCQVLTGTAASRGNTRPQIGIEGHPLPSVLDRSKRKVLTTLLQRIAELPESYLPSVAKPVRAGTNLPWSQRKPHTLKSQSGQTPVSNQIFSHRLIVGDATAYSSTYISSLVFFDCTGKRRDHARWSGQQFGSPSRDFFPCWLMWRFPGVGRCEQGPM